ncbi:BcepGomrgp72 [Burkholderia phage BcepGomr]|uniref:BcepGomrgp72 n=1 Tax=Burkholderia phage BcepGomr TaxID=437329 RepID=UPI0001503554|nr:BcepGomrgp72 [Burkholderia phage BcepGomr]ABP63643.1 BcepGomrgp72 [Burkholderia phage BcepGomr]
MQATDEGLVVKAKALIAVIGTVIAILTSCISAVAWTIGKYNTLTDGFHTLDRRVSVVEATNVRMADDVKESKAMLMQLLSSQALNRNMENYRR